MAMHRDGRGREVPPLSERYLVDGVRDGSERVHLFIGGLDHSGTSLLYRFLCRHPAVSGFVGTRAPGDEGQFLQDVFPASTHYGGTGYFAFDRRVHLTEESPYAAPALRDRLLARWHPYWDLSKRVLVERSAPNLMRGRFLQALFPNARFLFVIRHPVAVAMSTSRRTRQPLQELIDHWGAAHEVFLDDLASLRRHAWLRYEDFVAAPQATFAAICRFAGIAPLAPVEPIDPSRNDRAFAAFAAQRSGLHLVEPVTERLAGEFGYALDAPYYDRAPGSLGLTEPRDVIALRRPPANDHATPAPSPATLVAKPAVFAREVPVRPGAARDTWAGEGPPDEVDGPEGPAPGKFRRSLDSSVSLLGRFAALGGLPTKRALGLLGALGALALLLECVAYRILSPIVPPGYLFAEDIVSAALGWCVVAYCGWRVFRWLSLNWGSSEKDGGSELIDLSLLAAGGLLLISPGVLTTVFGLLLLLHPARRLGVSGFARMVGARLRGG